jgi:hypothetical protein
VVEAVIGLDDRIRFLKPDAPPENDWSHVKSDAEALLLVDQEGVPAGTWCEYRGGLSKATGLVKAPDGRMLVVRQSEIAVVPVPMPPSPKELVDLGYVEEMVHQLDPHDFRRSVCGRTGRWVSGHLITNVSSMETMRYPVDCPACRRALGLEVGDGG